MEGELNLGKSNVLRSEGCMKSSELAEVRHGEKQKSRE